jgi:hypothetical protein
MPGTDDDSILNEALVKGRPFVRTEIIDDMKTILEMKNSIGSSLMFDAFALPSRDFGNFC